MVEPLEHGPGANLVRLRAQFQGRVQGVGFRFTTQHLARSLGVAGFVKNEPDGSVVLEVEGKVADCEALVAAVVERMGKLVRDHQVKPIGVRGETVFDVRY